MWERQCPWTRFCPCTPCRRPCTRARVRAAPRAHAGPCAAATASARTLRSRHLRGRRCRRAWRQACMRRGLPPPRLRNTSALLGNPRAGPPARARGHAQHADDRQGNYARHRRRREAREERTIANLGCCLVFRDDSILHAPALLSARQHTDTRTSLDLVGGVRPIGPARPRSRCRSWFLEAQVAFNSRFCSGVRNTRPASDVYATAEKWSVARYQHAHAAALRRASGE